MFDQLKQLSQLGPLMAQARDMQAKMAQVQARLPALRGTGDAGGGLVTAVASGTLEIVELKYAPQAMRTDPELLADLTRAAVNQALHTVQDLVQREMQEAAGGLDLGAMRGLLGG